MYRTGFIPQQYVVDAICESRFKREQSARRNYQRNVYERKVNLEEINVDDNILWTGIKVIDFFSPIQKGFKLGLLGGAGVGKTVVIKELINNIYKNFFGLIE